MNNKRHPLCFPLSIIGILVFGACTVFILAYSMLVVLIIAFAGPNDILLVLLLFFIIAAIITNFVLSILLCVKSIKTHGFPPALLIAFNILNMLLFISCIILMAVNNVISVLIVPALILCTLTVMGFVILASGKENVPEPANDSPFEQYLSPTMAQKIDELKKLHDLCIISDEQFTDALADIISKRDDDK